MADLAVAAQRPKPADVRRQAAEVAQSLALGLAVFALAWLSIDLTRQSGRVAAIWPVNGVALVCLLRTDSRRWPGLLASSLLGVLGADLAWGNPLVTALSLSVCNGLEIGLCAAALRRLAGRRLDLQRRAHLWLFAGICGLAGPVIAACANIHVIVATAHTTPLRAWTTWVLADSLGMLVLVPPLLLLCSTAMARTVSSKLALNTLGMILLATVVTAVFLQSRPPLLFLISPALVLVTFQMEVAGAALGVLLIAAIAGALASMGYGPQAVVGGDLTVQMVSVQLFLLVCAITSLPIGATLAERRQVKARLAASEARYRLLADSMTDITVLLEADATITYVSPSVRRLGYEPEEVVGRRTLEFVHPDDREAVVRALTTGAPVGGTGRLEYRVLTKAGDVVWLEGSPTLLRDEAGNLTNMVTTYRDVTARRRLEEDLVAAKSLAEAAAEAKSEFLANMSHEIRTPLTGVIGFAELLDAMPGLPPEAELCVRRIAVASQSLLAVVNDVLDFSKLEAGQVDLAPHPFDPARLTRDAVEIVAGQARDKGLALDLRLDPSLPAFVLADSGRLRQVLLNLVGNAVKFTDTGSVRVSVSHIADAAPRLVFAVSDTGPGIPADRLGRLFQRFSQIDGSSGRQYGGAGLGLAICHELTRLMSGYICVESEVGQGSTFRFEIAAPIADAGADAEDPVTDGGHEATILVVDDVAVNRELVRAMLTPLGYKIVEAASGLEALDLCAGGAFDLILMDLQMPVMDGLTTTRAVRALGPGFQLTPILAISANVLEKHLAACDEAGMDDHIAKPIRAAELVTKVQQWLHAGRHQPLAAARSA
jgi:PAS domain S-box-containing protein